MRKDRKEEKIGAHSAGGSRRNTPKRAAQQIAQISLALKSSRWPPKRKETSNSFGDLRAASRGSVSSPNISSVSSKDLGSRKVNRQSSTRAAASSKLPAAPLAAELI
jgi:hypothetical protein